MPVSDLLLESFRRNARVNTALLDSITPEELALTDGRGGPSVAHLLGHMATFRGGWLSNISPAHAEPLHALAGKPVWEWESRDPAALAAMFAAGDEAAVQAVIAAVDEGRTFPDPYGEGTYQSNPAHFLMHTIVHDSHHRGQLLTLLRQGGRTKEQMDALDEHWAIWRE